MSCPYQPNGAPQHICNVVGMLTQTNVRPDWHGSDQEVDEILRTWDQHHDGSGGSKYSRASVEEATRAATEMFESLGVDPSTPEAADLIAQLRNGRLFITRGNAANMTRMGWVVKLRRERGADAAVVEQDRTPILVTKTARYAEEMKTDMATARIFAEMEELGPDMSQHNAGFVAGKKMTFDGLVDAIVEWDLKGNAILKKARASRNNAEWLRVFDSYRQARSFRQGLMDAQEELILWQDRLNLIDPDRKPLGDQ